MYMKFKLICLIAVMAVLCMPVVSNAQSVKPIQIALFTPIQIHDSESSISGIRINFIYSVNKDLTGYDVGFINRLTGDLNGAQGGFVNIVDGNVMGMQGSWI